MEVCKGSQICTIIGIEGNRRHLKRNVDEGGVRRKRQLRWWYGRQEEHITSPEEVPLFTDSCCGEPVHFILTPLYNLCSE